MAYVRKAAVGLGWTLIVALWGCALAKAWGEDQRFALILLSVATGYLYWPAWGIAIAAGVARRWTLLALSLWLVAVHVFWLRPQGWIAESVPEDAPSLRIMSANVLFANEDTEGILAEIREAQPDILLVQELAPQWAEALDAREWRNTFPYRIRSTREDAFGIGLYSKLPLVDSSVETLDRVPWIRAFVEVEGRKIQVWNMHTIPPRNPDAAERWGRMMEAVVAQAETSEGTVILGGDFNTTPYANWYTRLTNTRLRASHEACGRGWATTWPNGVFPIPPLRLDHVFITEDLGCVSVREGEGRGSDHLPLVVDLVLR